MGYIYGPVGEWKWVHPIIVTPRFFICNAHILQASSRVTVNTFLDTLLADPSPSSLMWLPLLHRMAAVEHGKLRTCWVAGHDCAFSLPPDHVRRVRSRVVHGLSISLSTLLQLPTVSGLFLAWPRHGRTQHSTRDEGVFIVCKYSYSVGSPWAILWRIQVVRNA